ncbi:hypothetical protein C2E20_8142 [Micractinium conductrix]|uniref:Ysc84 actin-binding domain-containing protein n=1 Tax=Micractinium conductrix TaxID=554055 RepID=A0A2P6V2G5_9CHLO|nr:hypothetical protein C2E20_8142 [Micractinium conductrix]|eukprot:PSC68298.1 hypothetical protein C2E20_8142 [Micractinium conductrix]
MTAQVPAPQLPQPPSALVASKLAAIAADTVRLIHDLTDVRAVQCEAPSPTAAADEVHIKAGVMPKSAVTVAQALAFIFRRKRGALLGLSRERAFVVARKDDGEGGTAWSGPVFCKGGTLSLGLTAGWLDLRACWAIEGHEGMHQILQKHSLSGLNASFLLNMNSTYLRPLRPTGGSVVDRGRRGGMVAKFFMVEAMLVDLSIRGGSFKVDEKFNATVYGADVSMDDVLCRRVPPPPQFDAVLDLLDECSRQGRMAMHRGGGGSSGVRLTPVSQGGAGSGGSTPQLSARSLTGRGASSRRGTLRAVLVVSGAPRMAAQVPAGQLPPRPARVASKLSELSAETMRLIRDLTAVRNVERAPSPTGAADEICVKTGVMPRSAVTVAQALAFIFRRKRGALLGLSRERAFVVARLDDGEGGTAWSGPVFCKGGTLSLGLTAGWLDMRVCWAIEGEGPCRSCCGPTNWQ